MAPPPPPPPTQLSCSTLPPGGAVADRQPAAWADAASNRLFDGASASASAPPRSALGDPYYDDTGKQSGYVDTANGDDGLAVRRVGRAGMRPGVNTKTDRLYGCYLGIVGVVTLLLVVGLTVLVAMLFLNFTFVFDGVFVHDDVPFYVTPADSSAFRQATRYGVNYVLISLFALKYITLFLVFGVIVIASRGGGVGWVIAVMVWITLAGVYDVAVSVYWLIVAYMPLKCSVMNICRAWTSVAGDSSADAGVPNWTFLVLAWSGVAWAAVNIASFLVLLSVQKLIEKRSRLVLATAPVLVPVTTKNSDV